MPAWDRIEIQKEKLENLYLKQKLSIAKIAEKLNCSTGPVLRSLREYEVPTRTLSEACTKVPATKKQLKVWYFKDKLSMFEIADKLGCTHSAVVYKFKKLGIKSRGHLGLTRPIKLTKKGFEYLYDQRRLSLKKIAKIAHCSKGGLEKRFKKYRLKSRGIKNRACKYKKFNFSRNPIEKAYMIGFRLGDLNIKKCVNTIQTRCSTTHKAQVKLIKSLFLPYTTPYIWRAKRGTWEIVCSLNKSFKFLLPKLERIPSWVKNNKMLFWSFFAGYSDAEGSIPIFKDPKATQLKQKVSFTLSSYDYWILKEIHNLFSKFKIESYFFLKSPRGTRIGQTSYFSNKDAWCVSVNTKSSLWKLVHYWKIFSKHREKQDRIEFAIQNIKKKNTIKWARPIDLSTPYLVVTHFG